uniref:Photosystem I assembly protein Ycf4 n=1 Tax=Sesbania grandiflora TaxID=206309 RepID=A0A6H0EIH7_SESGR|nr:photosystem I assembly protein Ycf4 [Sesbania grandiflora]QIT01299.1 photosystem I assembly protein Ycf4 [Sesbania grandiflora]
MWLWSNVWESKNVRIDYIPGRIEYINYFWAISTLLVSLAALLISLSGYFHTNLLFFIWPDLHFNYENYNLGGGILLGLYGISCLFLSLYLWIIIWFEVGTGYNLFDKKSGKAFIFRQHFPGSNRRLSHLVPLFDIQCLRIQSIEETTKDGTFLRAGVLYMQTGHHGIIPLTPIGNPWPPSKVAQTTGELARFLDLPIKIGYER